LLLSISLTFTASCLILTASRGVFAEDGDGADESILCMPGGGVGVEFSEEDVDFVCLSEDMLGSLQKRQKLSIDAMTIMCSFKYGCSP
jgi:hypothetical protein